MSWLLQDRGDVWQHFAVCVLLNQTQAAQVAPILGDFITRYPTPQMYLESGKEEVLSLIRRTGFGEVKERRLRELAGFLAAECRWDPDGTWPPGVGRYAMDSYRILFLGQSPEVTDEKLRSYLAYKNRYAARARRPRRRRKDHAGQPARDGRPVVVPQRRATGRRG